MAEIEVVISGIGATFPDSSDVQQFGKDLLDNKWLLKQTNRYHDLGVEAVTGHVPYETFDHIFYGINNRLAENTDPVSKLGYQRSFEAIVDAGLHPHAMRGRNVGVYAGSGVNEFEQRSMFSLNSPKAEGYCVMGISRTMFCNRISYFFDFRGPSCAMDSSWPVAHLQLQLAAQAIRDGQCEAAVVVCANLARYPETSYLLNSLGLINAAGAPTKCFDQDGSGSVRSDACVALFLQRSDQAKRCYAKVLGSSMAFTGKSSSIDATLPDPRGMQAFLSNFYRSHSIDPRRIAYLEADGSANVVRDECELNVLDAVLFKEGGRKEPLLVGSVRSNVGHTDCVSALASICKTVVAMETGVIPATINYRTPNARAEGLTAGRLRVVAENTPLQHTPDSVVAINTLGLTSMMGHTVLQANPRGPQPPQDPAHHLPRLITVSGRNEDGVSKVVKQVQEQPFDTNYYRLVQDAFSEDIRGYDYRSYVICPAAGGEVAPIERVEKRSVWFVYSGMGSQWAGMGAGLMSVPVFAETIERLHAVLEPRGLSLKDILTDTSPGAFKDILESFVGITACQIALTNVLAAVGLVPDGIVGHSVGELGCAYADGCLTEEQTILAAYARGVASNQATLIRGMMAAIGLGAKDIRPKLPPSVDIACHNSSTSCTLSGPAADVNAFVEQLSAEGVFARAVNAANIAYHSRYIQPAAPFLLQQLKEVIPEPRPRSDKWLTTSVPDDQQESDLAKYCSAEYQTNNLLSPVLFEEALARIPKQALLIEIAPHGLLQAILKRALPDPEYKHVSLSQRGHAHPVHCLLAAIGRTSFAGAAPNVAALYPAVEFPVPRGTASLATLATWKVDETTFNDTFTTFQEMVVYVHRWTDNFCRNFFPYSRQCSLADACHGDHQRHALHEGERHPTLAAVRRPGEYKRSTLAWHFPFQIHRMFNRTVPLP
ncbi:hypothetical protein ONE63_005988 [Megalurothrips usitatus]|uniref:Ketosynthase family 3 (KS3) domain-containing protein n=1 Tax=Megalurothrips usitatus TaxID=439358 RepID=A0AAV7XUK7_9NEOP|nr:hypothetical protein ONE63_005988 [Megalurothrips usitatus]